ncbi:substrate-binding domain-containing protein [Silvibacterium dinghuense]|uniref:Sugar ABC transporter substrate-binding protein n=1 Tax=Silvibacterium dinghuense TaxID=1560006 RepID=A0A4Q1SHQ7_9BACT|nr:substrate-binding domain-containing protein [Silvibacterium dinghuense]RXS97104.1 sugar ABC transporter substrate-binding protein [Silvibacterium dinghuense]GGG96255.1 sugar ABC transporter substrate-binding protein [Silvibacterium dinghuense]
MYKLHTAGTISVLLTLVLLGGCGRHSNKETYYLVSNNLNLPYWKTAVAGFEKAAAEYDVTAKVVGPQNYDASAESQAFDQAVATNPSGILVSVADASAMQSQIDAALAKGVPVITMDSDAPHSHRIFFIGTNNREAGHLGGQRVVDRLGGKGNVVFFTMPGQPNLDERLNGYMEIFAQHPGIKVAEIFNIKGDSGNAMDKTPQYLAQTGANKVDAFICLEASAGKDVAEVLKRQKATDRLLIAMDVDPDTLNLIKEGVIDATIAQKPYTMAYYGLKALDEIHHAPLKNLGADFAVDTFSPVPVFIDTGTAQVDKDNVDIYAASATQAGQQ